MLNVLLKARWRHYVNFVRHHFDRPTLLILSVIAGWLAYQGWRSPEDIGVSLRAFSRPGFGMQWLKTLVIGLPLIFGLLFLIARMTLRESAELDLLRALPIPAATLTLSLVIRHLSVTGPILLLLALPALGGSRLGAGNILRATGVLLAGLALDYLALRSAQRIRTVRHSGTPKMRQVRQFPITGGSVSALILRDLSYLFREAVPVLILLLGAIAVEGWILIAAGNPAEGLIMAAVVHALHAGLQMGGLDVLFKRDASAAGLLRSLPISGARLWRARAILAVAVVAAPGIVPLVAAIARGATPAAWVAFLFGAIVALPLCTGLLYADVHVALFPRTRVATFLLMTALVFIVLFWFFVPIATPILVIGLLVHWGLRAAGAFDRLELE